MALGLIGLRVLVLLQGGKSYSNDLNKAKLHLQIIFLSLNTNEHFKHL